MFALSLTAAAYAADTGLILVAPACRSSQLRMSVDARDGAFTGMSHSGVGHLIANGGADCTLPASPTIELRDAHGWLIPAARQVPRTFTCGWANWFFTRRLSKSQPNWLKAEAHI